MTITREQKAKLNIFFSLLGQIITLACGLIVPRLLLNAFGSEAYGATASITQFLAYITLLEGGIGGVARAALYKPLAESDDKMIGAVIYEVKAFFRVIGSAFILYVLILACAYHGLANVKCFDWLSTFLLVLVISLSTIAQYFIGISYSVLLQAAQKTYITQITSSLATILNTLCIVILVFMNCNLIIVKLASSIVFSLKPIILWICVKKEFNLNYVKKPEKIVLKQKWTGLGQHIAFFLHSNTDIAILTIFSNLSYVAVYSVYNMVVAQIQNITASFTTGMESVFGDMLAKKEIKELKDTFTIYESIISFVANTLFSVTAVMLVPFVQVYTRNIADVNYIYPVFAVVLVVASYFYCLRTPYHSMTIAAGHFKQTKFAAYGEAIINITVSIALVIKFDLLGVAIGTLVAVLFRFTYYVVYLYKNIFFIKISLFFKRTLCNVGSCMLTMLAGHLIADLFHFEGYYQWIICSCAVTILAIIVQIIVLLVFYKENAKLVLQKLIRH